MYDYHIHSAVSFDSKACAKSIAEAAKNAGIKEICFTDHCDYHSDKNGKHFPLDLKKYKDEYDALSLEGLSIRLGVEFGMTEWNTAELAELLSKRDFDFVIGSVHFVDGADPYDKEFWEGKTEREAYGRYLEKILECIEIHDDFDVLGHLSYVSRSIHNPTKNLLRYEDYKEISDKIFTELIKKGKGIEINTSGYDALGDFLPSEEFLVRFKELGGKIVTVGSDAHSASRVGQHIDKALDVLKRVFGYVCTFEKRQVKFISL